MAANDLSGEIIVRILGLEGGAGAPSGAATPRPPGMSTITPGGLFLPPGVMAPPSVSGTGGIPSSPGGGRGVAASTNPLMTPEQQEALKSMKQQERWMAELKDYQKRTMGEEEKKQTGLLSGVMAGPLKFLAGSLGIVALISQSKILGATMSTFLQMIGAIVDLILLPLVPGIAATLQLIAKLIGGLSKFMQDPTAFLKDVFVSVFSYIKGVFEAWLAPLKTLWDGIKTIAEDVVSLVKALFSLDWDEVVTAAKKVWEDIKIIAGKVWDDIKAAFFATFPFLAGKETPEAAKNVIPPGQESSFAYENIAKTLFGPIYPIGRAIIDALNQAAKEVFSKPEITLKQEITIDPLSGNIRTVETIFVGERQMNEIFQENQTRTYRA